MSTIEFTRFKKTAKVVSIIDMVMQVLYMLMILSVCTIAQTTKYWDDILEFINDKFQSSDQYWVMDSSSEKSKKATQVIYIILWIYAGLDCLISISQIGAAVALLLSANPAKDLKSSSKLANGWFGYNIICFVLYAAWRVFTQYWLMLVAGFVIRMCLLALGYKYVRDLRIALEEDEFQPDPNKGVNGINLKVKEPIPPIKREMVEPIT